MKKYIVSQESYFLKILSIWIFMIIVINSKEKISKNITLVVHENLEDIILKGMKDIFTEMNLNYYFYENQHYIEQIMIQTKLKNLSNHFKLEFNLKSNQTEISLYKTSPKSSLRKKEILVRKIKILDKSILDLETEFSKHNKKEPFIQTRIMFFEMIIPKFLHILNNITYNLEINLLSNKRIFFRKSFHMTSNQKIIKMIDFDDLLNPNFDDFFTVKKDDLEINQKKIFFSKFTYKFNSILSLVEYETSKDYIDNPCYLNGYFRIYPKILGSGDFEKCYKLIKHVIKKLRVEKNEQSSKQNITSIFLGTEFSEIFSIINKTNITLKELKQESQHYCDLRYQYMMFLFENDKKFVDSICFKMSYSVILIEKISKNDSLNISFENTEFNDKSPQTNFFKDDYIIINLSKFYTVSLTKLPLAIILPYSSLIILFILLSIFKGGLVSLMANYLINNNLKYDKKKNQKLLKKLIENSKLTKLFADKSLYRKEFIEFERSEIVFTYKGYLNFLTNFIEINKSFLNDLNSILYQEDINKSRIILQIIIISNLIMIGFIMNDLFKYISFVNDRFEEKQHLLYIGLSIVYFILLIANIRKFDFQIFLMNNSKDFDDELNGNSIKI